MLYREIIAVCSQIHTKHINTACGQNVELLNVKLAVHIVTTGLQWVNVGTVIVWVSKWSAECQMFQTGSDLITISQVTTNKFYLSKYVLTTAQGDSNVQHIGNVLKPYFQMTR